MSIALLLEGLLGKLEADAVRAIAFEETGGPPDNHELITIAIRRIHHQVVALDERLNKLLELDDDHKKTL